MMEAVVWARDDTTKQIKPLLVNQQEHQRSFLPQTVPAGTAIAQVSNCCPPSTPTSSSRFQKQIASFAFYNKEVVYGILFRATSQTLLLTAAERLGVELGFFWVLHSWGQNMHFHPHLHCVVPGGGLSFLQERWIAAKRRFFLPVKALSRRFRKLMLKGLTKTVWYMLSLPRGPHPCLVVSRPLYSPRRHQ